ncbi:hypothetical protein M446_6729 [Methylobacterium sp. 4-46]|uniref:hypothetical protein n=1 Tax=unclassified Methylobacterium TaxID=2615210 RepID=UPI000152D41F|nr:MULTISPECIES: hypothetical protein [Methylobacterium]ACA20979.1 hypothetical protein M446_6729 [Methylobacterium sp. 4-46]WFT80134.1 hypothetical protein QA634_33985 [Methylobacterium nodulans]
MDLSSALNGNQLPEPLPFDYSAMSPLMQKQAKDVVKAYRRRTGLYVVETGHGLLSVKDGLDHGLFTQWVEAEMGMSLRHAENFMQAARVFAEDDKREIISVSPATTICKLAAPSTPEPLRQKVVKRLVAGERLRPAAVDAMVAEARKAARDQAKAEKEAARVAALSPEELKRETARKKGRERSARISAEKRDAQSRQWKENLRRREEADTKLVHLLATLPPDTIREIVDLLREGGHFQLREKLSLRLRAVENGERPATPSLDDYNMSEGPTSAPH